MTLKFIQVTIAFQLLVFSVNLQDLKLEVPQETAQPSVSISIENVTTKKYYFEQFFKANFFKAQHYCTSIGMRLLSIDSTAEEKALFNYMHNEDFPFRSTKFFWTSGTDLADEGTFFFMSTGTQIRNLTWHTKEPNNAQKKNGTETENCVAIVYSENQKSYKLSDKFCSSNYHFICEEGVGNCKKSGGDGDFVPGYFTKISEGTQPNKR